jgi:hypothetical protein
VWLKKLNVTHGKAHITISAIIIDADNRFDEVYGPQHTPNLDRFSESQAMSEVGKYRARSSKSTHQVQSSTLLCSSDYSVEICRPLSSVAKFSWLIGI